MKMKYGPNIAKNTSVIAVVASASESVAANCARR